MDKLKNALSNLCILSVLKNHRRGHLCTATTYLLDEMSKALVRVGLQRPAYPDIFHNIQPPLAKLHLADP